MKTRRWIVSAAVTVLVAAGGAAPGIAGDEAASPSAPATASVVKHQTICPIEGGDINKKLFADYQGKRVYFCCNSCPPEFKKDPAKYIRKMEAQGITLDTTPQAATTNAPAASPR